jgi:hypothetical protein
MPKKKSFCIIEKYFNGILTLQHPHHRCAHSGDKCIEGLKERNHLKEPNVVVWWLTLLLRIQEIPGSHLGTETSSPE